MSHNLDRQMENLGIRVSSVSVGPVGQSNNVEHDVKRYVIQAHEFTDQWPNIR